MFFCLLKERRGFFSFIPSLTKEKNDTWEVRKQFLENCVEVEKQEVEALEAEVRVK
jgi:hypothetical protein